MSFIINKKSTGGSNITTSTATFSKDLAYYGQSVTTLEAEVKSDFLRELTTVTQQTSFNREAGIGIDLYENESISEFNKVRIRLDIMSAVYRYNLRAVPEKRIIVSQDTILIEEGRGSLNIDIYYIIESQLNASQGLNNLKNITLPLG